MGTYAHVELPSEREAYKAYRVMHSLERKLSDYIGDSEVSKVNRKAGISPVVVSPETLEVVRLALEVSKRTYGYFDITIGSVTVNHKRLGLIPLNEAQKLVNFRNVVIGKNTLFLKHKGMAIDLGGIGKGYALDVAYRTLDSPWGFIGIAGDMKVWGTEKVLAVKDPLSGGSLLQGVNRGDLCISTSGNYVKRHIDNRDRELVQVTVVHDTCSLADAYATALFSMPRSSRRNFLKENPDVGVLELYSDGSLYMNDSFRKRFRLLILKTDTQSQ